MTFVPEKDPEPILTRQSFNLDKTVFNILVPGNTAADGSGVETQGVDIVFELGDPRLPDGIRTKLTDLVLAALRRMGRIE